MTDAAKLRLRGFLASLRVRGRVMQASGGEMLRVMVEEVNPLSDPTDEAKARNVVYAVLHAQAGVVANARGVTSFVEVKEGGGRTFTVLRYDEKASDEVGQQWFCEAQRE